MAKYDFGWKITVDCPVCGCKPGKPHIEWHPKKEKDD